MRLVEVDEGEHLSADGFVADPEDEVRAPLHRLHDMGEGEEIGAEARGVHGAEYRAKNRCDGGRSIVVPAGIAYRVRRIWS